MENLEFRHLCLADPKTGSVFDELTTLEAPCPDMVPPKTLELLSNPVRTAGVTFDEVVDLSNDKNVIHLLMRRDDRLATGAIATAYFLELGQAISFDALGHSAIIDHTGRALSHPLPD